MERARWDETHPQFYDDFEELFDENPYADLVYWSKVAYWTIEEGTALSYGCEPRVVNWDALEGSEYPFAAIYAVRRDLAMRARDMGQLQEKK